MTVIESRELRRHIRTLDSQEFTRFVADLWRCRGYDVAVRDGVIHARSPSRGTNERIVVTQRSLMGWTVPSDEAEIVVARRTTRATRRVARSCSATFVGLETLQEVVNFAITRTDRRRLFETHFGCSPDEVRSTDKPLSTASRRELLVVVLLLTSVGVIGTVVSLNEPPVDQIQQRATPRDPGQVVTQPPDPPSRGGDLYPPGIDENGVYDAARLSRRHAQQLEQTSYRFLRTTRIASARSRAGDERVGYRRIVVNDTLRFRTESDGNLPLSEGGFGSVHAEVFADGTDVYRRVHGEDRSVYLTGPRLRADRFQNQGAWFVSVYLATAESAVSQSSRSAQRTYLVTGRGTPEQLDGNVSNYTATAVVDADGLVRSLNVSYDRTTNGTTQLVSLAFEYRDVGNTTVTAPSWYPEARTVTGAANESPAFSIY